jgi:intracellular multiplication protein IcmB
MSVAGILSNVMQAIGVGAKRHLSSFSFLETVADDYTIIAKDGSMMTLLRIDGVKKVIGQDELNNIVDRMNVQMSPYLADEGQAIQVWFARDPDLSGEMIREMLQGPRGIAKRLSLDLDDVFEERQRTLPKWVVWEGFYIALWTRMSVLTKKEREIVKRRRKIPKIVPSLADAQNPLRIGTALKDRHNAFVRSFESDLKDIEIRFKTMDTDEAIQAIGVAAAHTWPW